MARETLTNNQADGCAARRRATEPATPQQHRPPAWAAFGAMIAALLVAMSMTSCSAEPDTTLADPVATQPAATATTEGATPPLSANQSGSGGCILNNDQVGQAVQLPIINQSINGGGATSQGLSFSWSGCSYETEAGERYTVGRLADTEVFDGLRVSASRNRTVAGLGNEAFFSRDDLYVVSGGETVVLGVDGASLEPSDIAQFADLATALLAIGGSDARCDALPSLVPAVWQPGDTVLRGGGGTSTITFDSCSVAIAAVPSGSITLRTSTGRQWFDEAADSAPDVAFALPGIGDETFALNDRLFVLVGATGIVVGLDDIDAMTSETLQSLAAAATDALLAS